MRVEMAQRESEAVLVSSSMESDLESQVEEMRIQIKTREGEHAAALATRASELQEMQAQMEEMRSQCKIRDSELQELREALGQAQQKTESFVTSEKSLRIELETVHTEMTKLQTASEKSAVEHDDTKQRYRVSQERAEEQEAKIADLTRKFEGSTQVHPRPPCITLPMELYE